VKAVWLGGTVPTVAHGPPAAGPRSIRNPCSFEEPSIQNRSIRFEEVTMAPNPEGAPGGAWGVVALAVFEYAEKVLPRKARTR
jgi:hypothetical protein